jgi:hypothetical protein
MLLDITCIDALAVSFAVRRVSAAVNNKDSKSVTICFILITVCIAAATPGDSAKVG